MKSRLQVGDDCYTLEWTGGRFHLTGVESTGGEGSVVEVQPGVFSVITGTQQVTVHVLPTEAGWEATAGNERMTVQVSDARDRAPREEGSASGGRYEIKSQMPGKIVEVLVKVGENVRAGQGLLVIEAMKMQNEVKATRDGVVAKIHAVEGATVGAAAALLVIDPPKAR